MTMSKGEFRVGIDFNPSGDSTVTSIKDLASRLIDLIEEIEEPVPTSVITSAEVSRLKALAQTAIEDGAMWGVKAATKKEFKGNG